MSSKLKIKWQKYSNILRILKPLETISVKWKEGSSVLLRNLYDDDDDDEDDDNNNNNSVL
jgi:hypothetical protein